MELNYGKVNNMKKRLKNFDTDLRDGLVFSSLILSYVGDMEKV